jgi:hypothetical protein
MSGIKDYSTTPANNTALFPEGMARATVNDSSRQVQADIRSWYETAEWVDYGYTPTYASTTSFTMSGDKTAFFLVGRRIKMTDATTLYGTIATSSFGGGNTTVTVTMDSGSLSASLTAVALGIVSTSGTGTSLPSVGNVTGQSSSVDSEIALFSGTGGKTIKRTTGTGVVKVSSGVYQTPATIDTADITNNAVTLAKIANASANSKIVGSGASGSGAAYSELSLGSGLSMSGTTLDVATGSAIQFVSTFDGAVATGTTTTPDDDTIPQSSEGTEFITRSITPKSSTSILKVDVCVNFAFSAGASACVALFRDSAADAAAAQRTNQSAAAGRGNVVTFSYFVTSGSTSATTFKVRIGMDSASTVTFNGTGGARKFGGVMASSISITEYSA